MSTVVFDGLTLREPKVKRRPAPLVNSSRLVSGKKKLTVSSEVEISWQVCCLTIGDTEYAALLAKCGIIGTLTIDGSQFTKCTIKSWPDEKEINPSTVEVTLNFERDTT